MIDFNKVKTTRNRIVFNDKLNAINENLSDYLSAKERAGVLASIIEESGGNPTATDATGKYRGLMQWAADRYMPASSDSDTEMQRQLRLLRGTLFNADDGKSWTDGGRGSGYRSRRQAYADFHNPDTTLSDSFRGLSFGYVRPTGKDDSYRDRLAVTMYYGSREVRFGNFAQI